MIKEARETDLDHIVLMARELHDFSEQMAPLDPEHFKRFCQGLIENMNACLFVSENGMIGGTIIPAYTTANWRIAVEVFWWAEDGQGLFLLREFERWAKRRGADEIRMTTQAGKDTRAKKALDRMGYKESEVSYARAN